MKVVIVESPAKAKTINKYLGKDYTVIASYGHMRDLPSKSGSVLPNEDFKMIWEISDRGRKNLNEILRLLKGATHVCLATDPDREGEAISWHLLQMLQDKKAIQDKVVERVTFNEITQKAITTAFKNPRELNQELIDAYLARRALDYLVGFTLSPLLWRKLPGSRSAGRVQSVALRIITDRESEIEAFKTQEYWTIDVDLLTPAKKAFQGRLTHLNGEKLDKFSLNNEALAKNAQKTIESQDFTVQSVEQKSQQRNPYAPFITSTLQQEASRKIGMNATRTMRVAQNLYEGVDVRGETVGLITYMRTDGVQLSPDAITSIRAHILESYGDTYLPKEPRVYKSKVKNAQEAHEAIRPTDIARTPDSLRNALSTEEFKLYELIWKRAVASQMASAILDQVVVDMTAPDKKTILRANGSMLRFDGFLKLYQEDQDDKDDQNQDDKRLPPLKEQDPLGVEAVKPEQHFTEPPPRFTEASLVKKLEELGIGRPSTYATILQVLQDRHYVRLDKKRFFPEERGRLVTSFLAQFFNRYVHYGFTASLEEELDDISGGRINWKEVLKRFWAEFDQNITTAKDIPITEVLAKIEGDLERHFFPTGNRQCPTCESGKLGLKLGRFGAFLGCSNYPNCHHTQQLVGDETVEQSEVTDEIQLPKTLGNDPATGKEVSLRRGPFGVYLQMGEAEGTIKPKRATIASGTDLNAIDLPHALSLLNLPRLVGIHPESKLEIIGNIGRFGPYLKYGPIFISVPPAEDVLTMGINRAVTFIAEKRPDIRYMGIDPDTSTPILIYRSKYGYITSDGTVDMNLPKGSDAKTFEFDAAKGLLDYKRKQIQDEKASKRKSTKDAKDAKAADVKATPKKAPAKKATVKKTDTKDAKDDDGVVKEKKTTRAKKA
jgi:DNA topoisomerase-1